MRKNWIIFIAFVVMSIGVLSGCTQQSPSPPGNTNTITIQNYAFNPSTLTVKVGTNVTWINEDSMSHTVTSDDGLFESGSLSNGQTFIYTFNTPGTYNYHCSIHTSMTAKIIVE
jgi:plastocyanin